MATVAFLPHRGRPRAIALARAAIDKLTAAGHECRVAAAAADVGELAAYAVDGDALIDGLDLAVSLGGDGTMLHAVALVCGSGVPVLGVNVGHLGYLTESQPSELDSALDRFLSGEYTVEERMTLEVGLDRADGSRAGCWAALNEAVLEKTHSGHTIRVAVAFNGQPFTTYAADGMIVATPTGSTAYNLSARGPIVSPRHRCLLLTPVSPHMLFDRSMILDAAERIRLEAIGDRAAILVVDGRPVAEMAPGDAITCQAGPRDARLVSFGERDFHGILRAKFGLADR
jgi:NAD+ kinase